MLEKTLLYATHPEQMGEEYNSILGKAVQQSFSNNVTAPAWPITRKAELPKQSAVLHASNYGGIWSCYSDHTCPDFTS